jgi:hypothetical protein
MIYGHKFTCHSQPMSPASGGVGRKAVGFIFFLILVQSRAFTAQNLDSGFIPLGKVPYFASCCAPSRQRHAEKVFQLWHNHGRPIRRRFENLWGVKCASAPLAGHLNRMGDGTQWRTGLPGMGNGIATLPGQPQNIAAYRPCGSECARAGAANLQMGSGTPTGTMCPETQLESMENYFPGAGYCDFYNCGHSPNGALTSHATEIETFARIDQVSRPIHASRSWRRIKTDHRGRVGCDIHFRKVIGAEWARPLLGARIYFALRLAPP